MTEDFPIRFAVHTAENLRQIFCEFRWNLLFDSKIITVLPTEKKPIPDSLKDDR